MSVKQVIVFAVIVASVDAFLLHPRLRHVYGEEVGQGQHQQHGGPDMRHGQHQQHGGPDMNSQLMRCIMATQNCPGVMVFNNAISVRNGSGGIRLVHDGRLTVPCSDAYIQKTQNCLNVPGCEEVTQMMMASVTFWRQLCDNEQAIIANAGCLENPTLYEVEESEPGSSNHFSCINVNNPIEACLMSTSCIVDYVAAHDNCSKEAGQLVARVWHNVAHSTFGENCDQIPALMMP